MKRLSGFISNRTNAEKREKRGKSAAIVALVASVFAGASSSAFAVGGIGDESALPHFASSANKDDFEDLRVKVLGGEIRILRRWVGDRWEWNSRWNDLELQDYAGNAWPRKEESLTSEEREGLRLSIFGGCNNLFERQPFYATRNDQVYVLRYDRQGCPENPTYYNTEKRRITYNGDKKEFVWRDRFGNKIYYTRRGQMKSYADKNGVTVYLERDADGNILWVKDHFENEIIKFNYDPVVTDRLVSIHDCAYESAVTPGCTKNREVTYHYNTTGELVAISDLLNPYDGSSFDPVTTTRADWADEDTHKGWWMDYNNDKLTAYYDPLGRKTSLQISDKGELRSKFNSDGVGATYSSSYDKEKRQFYTMMRDGHGTVTETWYHDLGGIMRKDINGETVLSAEIVLSDDSDDTKEITKGYRVGQGAN